jgi:hypothetical protein
MRVTLNVAKISVPSRTAWIRQAENQNRLLAGVIPVMVTVRLRSRHSSAGRAADL